MILVELILTEIGKFPDSTEFQSWKVNFKTEICSKSADLHLTVHWIKEAEKAKSIDEHKTSSSIMERTDFLTSMCLMR